MTPGRSILDAALSVLQTADPHAKADQARKVARAWEAGELALPDVWPAPVDMAPPARPERPQPVAPGEVPRRRLTTLPGRVALIHAITHIELNAIDLAFDLIARFGGDKRLPAQSLSAFISDWVLVGDDEARHFNLLSTRLAELGAAYGDLTAHGGLWDAAEKTGHDLAARLAVAPLVLEARGLDVTPAMITRLRNADDPVSADILGIIYREEVAHVAAGMRWFKVVSAADEQVPQTYYRALVREHFKGHIKPPFNFDARDRADFPSEFYESLAVSGPSLA